MGTGEQPRARLRAIAPVGVAWSIEVGTEPRTIGRAPDDGTPPIDHESVSRQHARVRWDDGHRVADLRSKHGTEVDGDHADDVVLADGAILRIGGVFVAYELDAPLDDADDAARDALPGDSPAMVRLRGEVARLAGEPRVVQVIGLPGSGKSAVAAELHRQSRRSGPLVAAPASEALGAVDAWIARAHGGTLVLDDVDRLFGRHEAPLAAILRAPDLRVVVTAERELAAIAAHRIAIPPLGERRSDVPMWIARLWGTRDRALPELTPAAWWAVLGSPWSDQLHGVAHLVDDLAAPRAPRLIDRVDLPTWLREDAPTERRLQVTPPFGISRLRPVPPPLNRKR